MSITDILVCVCIGVSIIMCDSVSITIGLHHVCSSPNNAHLINHIPIFETVHQESAIKRILVFAVGCSEVAIPSIIGPLIRREVKDNCKHLKREKREMSSNAQLTSKYLS